MQHLLNDLKLGPEKKLELIKNSFYVLWSEAVTGDILKKVFLTFSQNLQGNTCVRVSFLSCRPLLWPWKRQRTFSFLKFSEGIEETCNFIKRDTLKQVFSCEFCPIFKNTFFTEHLWVIPSVWYLVGDSQLIQMFFSIHGKCHDTFPVLFYWE